MSLLVMALADLGVDAASFTGSQVGHHHRQRPHPGQDQGGQGRSPARGARRREGAGRGRVPGRLRGAGDHHPRPRRVRRDRGGPGRRPRRRRVRDLHGRHRRVHGRSADRARGAPDQPDLVRRDARDGGDRRAGADAAGRRVRPQPQRPAARAQQLHLGARHLGGRGGCRHGRSRRHRSDPRHLGGQGHRQRGAGPARGRRPAVPGAGGQVDQRRHDRAEHLGARHHGHLVHRPQDRPAGLGRDGAGPRRRTGRDRGDVRPRRGAGVADRGRA